MSSIINLPKTAPDLPSPRLYPEAYEKTGPDRAELPADRVQLPNIDVQIGVTTILGTQETLAVYREQIARLEPIDMKKYDRIVTYAHAASYAQTLYLTASGHDDGLALLVGRADVLRARLLPDTQVLVDRGLLDGSRLADLKGGTGYLNTASDVGVLAHLLRTSWDRIHMKTAIELAELDEADQLREKIEMTFAKRALKPMAVAEAGDQRQRAYTLMVDAYDQARRAFTFLRWNEGDADKLVPSLWAGRGGRASSANESQGEDPAAPPAKADEPVAKKEGAAEGPAAAPAAKVPVGFPGSSPFST